ncbi:tyrosine--tRNA ligase [Isachenkonia alkalipeptolytica]|uniref:Tyrosine--tRNA ligase n=1 Tax=Isachenkonia alkalipeptolytica TaxID=2565777 RepID=A0AA44BG53_9CLOT|nr:tyrosine--tRNA ligase [Isachenkonia alkalipeptolytica]NBG89505.1 tyrosine--tRNA ligase [Isachenkonia alkalipeptolytica]
MKNVYEELTERGYIEQVIHEEELKNLLGKESVTFYIGFDATASSLTLGHFVQMMVIKRMQRAGHRPIILFGGGTTMIGDPSGKQDMRKMLTKETIDENIEYFKGQFQKYIDLHEDKAIVVNNAEWLLDLNYIEFIREIGKHFTINRMLNAECYKSRLDKGLTFLEFNYMIMQSYDFLELYRRYNCKLQVGGSDQWSNILGGYELVRKLEKDSVYALTFKLLTNSEGKKMGKTESGTIWLDPKKTSPYEFFQYLRNVHDADVENCLMLLTMVPTEEVKRLSALEGKEMEKAKEVLAYETTKLVHGEAEAKKALEAARAIFSGKSYSDDAPTSEMKKEDFEEGLDILTLLTKTGLISSRGEGRRLVQQGGIYVNEETVKDIHHLITLDHFEDNKLLIRKGKKTYHQVKVQ